ncbi:hypothetical protein F8154_05695 [Alkaliphilus pronyensis]|uniref:DUF5659 domain-containing protein n=1 Tax=Alkaliphilus pronyensis TaxID=1482732 RepID=A0A6I0F9Z8_9FIRM|nr:DUF5659 domain-containing protein [Alkaliphilus pronyensis]KAB3535624.1 hypothetical protein F8154_05695 [Alkaliphilus pronyensis]
MSINSRLITDKDTIVFLVAKGFKIINVQKDPERNRSLIYFADTKELRNAVLAYTNKSVNINIADYVAAEKRVRILLNMQKTS